MQQETKPHYLGHRKRLKNKVINSNMQSLPDYELLEILLFFSIPRRDVKSLAKNLLHNFGSIATMLYADKNKLLQFSNININTYTIFLIIRELIERILKERINQKNIISSWNALIDYLKYTMGNLQIEQFRVLFLNKKNMIISDEIMSVGTLDQAPVYPREVIKKALFFEASAIILAHNHPSGSVKPSRNDIDLTNKIAECCRAVNIILHDHIIISHGNQYYSFKSNLLL